MDRALRFEGDPSRENYERGIVGSWKRNGNHQQQKGPRNSDLQKKQKMATGKENLKRGRAAYNLDFPV